MHPGCKYEVPRANSFLPYIEPHVLPITDAVKQVTFLMAQGTLLNCKYLPIEGAS